MQDSITKALNWRYAVKAFDTTKTLDPTLVTAILESGRLAPSSDGYEPWKFIVIENKETRQKISAAGYGQPKLTEAPYLIAITYRTDPDQAVEDILARNAQVQNKKVEELGELRAYYEGGMAGKKAAGIAEEWFRRQTYIALGFMLETAALLGVDAGPMEGFDNQKVDEILGLAAKNLKVTSMLALGYRAAEPSRPKIRQAFDDVVEYVK